VIVPLPKPVWAGGVLLALLGVTRYILRRQSNWITA
jgi:hypothetical protein